MNELGCALIALRDFKLRPGGCSCKLTYLEYSDSAPIINASHRNKIMSAGEIYT